MNTEFTADTRPSMLAGVSICTSVARITTLTLSAMPLTASNTSDRKKLVDNPNPMIAIANTATATSNARPARSIGGRCARSTPISTAPSAGAARRTPNPCGPTCRISEANTGNSASAPPRNTEKRSSDMAPRMSGWLQTKRRPVSRFSIIGDLVMNRLAGLYRIDSKKQSASSISAAPTA